MFVLAGIFEIGGGWLVWQGIRDGRAPRWAFGIAGSIALVIYGFVPLLQPHVRSAEFGRIFAVYGGIFVVMSYFWGVIADGMKLDAGDYLGGALTLIGVLISLFWRR